MKIPILYEDELLKLGIEKEIMWWPDRAAHMILIGSTGVGKTYLSKMILAKVAIYVKDSEIIVNDAKGDRDFCFLSGSKNFYRFMECAQGLDEAYKRLFERQQGTDASRNMVVIYFDELAAYLNMQDKKQAEEEKRKMANILMLGRSFNIHVIISQQRADAQYFATARDNLNVVIGLGNLSTESKEMMFREYRHEMLPDRKRGTGYMLTNGTDLKSVYVPRVRDMDKLHRAIKEAVDRSSN